MSTPHAPRAEKRPTARSHHGDTFEDPYEWLSNTDSAEVRALLTDENAYTDARTAHLERLREDVYGEIKGRTLETDMSVPQRIGDWWYFTRSREGAQYGVHCRAPIRDVDDWTPPTIDAENEHPGERVVFDSNEAALGYEFFSLGSFDVSPDGSRLLYGIDTTGDERYTLRIRDLESGTDLPDLIEMTFAGAMFAPDGESVFYTTVDDAWRPDTVHRHAIGSTEPDTVVIHEPDDRYWVGVGASRSQRYVFFSISSSVSSEIRFVPADDITTEPNVVWPRRDGVDYDVEHAIIGGSDYFLITHNAREIDFEIGVVDVASPGTGPADGAVLVPATTGSRIEGVDAFENHLVLSSRRDGLTRVSIATLSDAATLADVRFTEVAFDEELFTVGASGNPEWTQPLVRYGFTSMITPSGVFDYDPSAGTHTLRKQKQVLGGYDPTEYEQIREWAIAADGTRVPISLIKRRDTTLPAPLHLYGYGSYEASMDPGFSIPRLSVLDRGGVFAIAHVRGGGELGRGWYESGKLRHKTNSFSDFVATARHLVEAGYTSHDRIVAEGASAGGLLVGAALNLDPTAFAGVLAGVPFVDALTTILKPELPLTVIEWDEWGDPLHDPEIYEYMRGYSPYENVRDDVTYPQIFATTSLNDTRVLVAEPVKWVQRLRDVGADPLLRIEMSAGHGGVTGRYDSWRERAEELAWILSVLGLDGTENDSEFEAS